jgi:hypothetical protein
LHEARSYPGSGSLWFGRNSEFADATFTDWGLARATATILNAVRTGQLVPAEPVPLARDQRCALTATARLGLSA